MSNTFKNIEAGDINYTEVELNRLYSFSDSTDSDLGVTTYVGISGSTREYNWTGSGQSSGFESRLIWTLTNKLIFEGNKAAGGVIPEEQATTPGVSMSVMYIPPNILGDGLKPGSLLLTEVDRGETFYDAVLGGRFGQIISGTAPLNTTGIGTVDYTRGIIAITHPSHSNIFSNYNMVFRNRMPIRSYEVTCRIASNEFLMTLNPTAMSGTVTESTYIPMGHTTNSAWSPYITTVGLYNRQGEMVVVGKLSQPIKKPYVYDLNIKMRYDL